MTRMTERLAVLSIGFYVLTSSPALAECFYARAGWTAVLPPGAHQAQAVVTVINDRTLYVEHFTYDGTAPAVYFYLGATNTNSDFENGLGLQPHLTRAYADEPLTLTLPPGHTLDDYGAISVWCVAAKANFTSNTFSAPAGGAYARAGWEATMPAGGHDARGVATIITNRLLWVRDFTYDGTAPAVYFYLGATNTYNAFLNGLQCAPNLNRAYADESLVAVLPPVQTLDGYTAVSTWCAAFDVNFTSASFVPPPPPMIASAVSRRTHGSEGEMDLDLLGGGMAVEGRSGGPARLLLTFDCGIRGAGGLDASDVTLASSAGPPGNVSNVAIDGSQLSVDLMNVPDSGALTVMFPGIQSHAGIAVVDSLCFGVLEGDANADETTNIFDLIAVRNELNQPVGPANYQMDVNADGSINIFDLIATRNNLNNTIAGSCP